MATQLDELFGQLGIGKWNLFHIAAVCYLFSLLTYHTLGGAFLAPNIDFTCVPPISSGGPVLEGAVVSQLPTDPQNDDEKSFSWEFLNVTQDQCSYIAQSQNGTIRQFPCTYWHFDNSTFQATVTSDFQLVCGREYIRAMYTSIYMLGFFFGASLNGVLADRYGRLPMIAISSIVYTFIAIGSCWLSNLSILLGARFLLGIMHPASLQTGYILAMESAPPKWRSEMGMGLFLTWALGATAWGGFAYLVRHWRYLQLTVSLPCFMFLPALLFMDESPRWLAVRGSYEKALQILKKAARWNGITNSFPSDCEIMLVLKNEQTQAPKDKESEDDRSFGEIITIYFSKLIILFRTPKLRLITLVMWLDYMVIGMVFFGLSFSGGIFSTDPFLYMILSGLMEVPGNTVTLPLVTRIGRRTLTVFFFLLSGGTLLPLPFLPEDMGWLELTLVMVGKMSITVNFNLIFLYSSELFPTQVRTRGMGTSFMLSRLGSMLAPFIAQYLGASYPSAPLVLFGATSLLAGMATLALPETRNTALVETVIHLEQGSTDSSQQR